MEKETADTIVKMFAGLAWFGAALSLVLGISILIAGPTLGGLLESQGPTAEAEAAMELGIGAAIILIIAGLAQIAVGYGLWQHQRWSRFLEIIMGVVSLLIFPIGTIYGIITIWLFGFQRDIRGIFTDHHERHVDTRARHA
jgi:hypothetical protein